MSTESLHVVDNQYRLPLHVALEDKFATYDRAVALGWVDHDSDFLRSEYFRLLEDPTIYAYAFFRNHRGEPLKMRYYQDAVLNCKSARVAYAAARQQGKSTTAIVLAAHTALLNPGWTVMLVSKTLPQSTDLLRRIKELLSFSAIDYKDIVGEEESKTAIYFKHNDEEGNTLPQSRIICVPASEAVRGYPVDLLILDEIAFYENTEYFYTRVAEPTTYSTKGRIICLSNPNGTNNYFYTLWQRPDFARFRFTFLDNPENTQEEYDALSYSLTREDKDSNLDAIFTDAAGSWLSTHERKAIQHDRDNSIPTEVTEPLYIFLDWAKSQDRTVRAVGSRRKNADGYDGVFVHELHEYASGTPYNQIVDDLLQLVERIGVTKFETIGWDNTGVGRGIEDFLGKLRNTGIRCEPVEFSAENKSRIYTATKILIERTARGTGNVGLDMPFIRECDRQLSNMVFKHSSRGLLQVHHANERDRDDYPDAVVGLCSLIVSPVGVTVTFI